MDKEIGVNLPTFLEWVKTQRPDRETKLDKPQVCPMARYAMDQGFTVPMAGLASVADYGAQYRFPFSTPRIYFEGFTFNDFAEAPTYGELATVLEARAASQGGQNVA